MSGAPVAEAQEAPPPSRQEALVELFSSVTPGSALRVATIGGIVEEGSFERAGRSGIDVLRAGATYSIDFEDVRTVSLRGSHGVQGALWGAAGGALVGGFFGAMYASFDCTTVAACNYTEKQGALRWGSFLGALGGGMGFFIGRRQVHWHPIFP